MKAIDELQTLLAKATDFGEPWSFFHDHLAMSPAFMALGRPAFDRELAASLEAIATRVMRTETRMKDPAAIHIPEHGMWHGLAEFGESMGIWFYFATSDKGLLGLSRNLVSGPVDLARFSRVRLDASGRPRLRD